MKGWVGRELEAFDIKCVRKILIVIIRSNFITRKVPDLEDRKAKVRMTELTWTRVKISIGQTCQQNFAREFSMTEVKGTSGNELPSDDQMEHPACEQTMQEDAL